MFERETTFPSVHQPVCAFSLAIQGLFQGACDERACASKVAEGWSKLVQVVIPGEGSRMLEVGERAHPPQLSPFGTYWLFRFICVFTVG